MSHVPPLEGDQLISVCAECLTASCWNFEFVCEKYRTADVVVKTVAELMALGREHPSHWIVDE